MGRFRHPARSRRRGRLQEVCVFPLIVFKRLSEVWDEGYANAPAEAKVEQITEVLER
jgi:hypothetical protein